MAATPKKAPKGAVTRAVAPPGGSAAVIAKAARAGAVGAKHGVQEKTKTKPRVDAVKTKAVRRADAVKAKIKAQVAGLDTTREARTTRVKVAVDAKRSSRTTRVRSAIATAKAKSAARAKGETGTQSARMSASGIPAAISKDKTTRTSRGTPTAVAKDKTVRMSSGVPAAIAKDKTARTKIPAAVVKPTSARIDAAVKTTIVKGRRVASTEEREVAALAIADAHAAAGTSPPKPRRRANDAGTTGANENASTTLSAAPLATIAPRGVFLPDRVVVDVEGDTFPRTKLDEHGRDEAILSGSTFDTLKQQVAEGQRHVVDDAPAAFRAFRAALELLPEPVQNWNAAGWLLVAMGECAIRMGDFAAAFAPLKDAMHCPGTIGNPWVHLLLGRCRLELGDERAADELARAYMGGGRALFDELDPKYFALVEHVLKPPPGHDRLP